MGARRNADGAVRLMTEIRFESSLRDGESRDEHGQVVRPAGFEHSALLASLLKDPIKIVASPWKEEGYAWEFLATCNRVKVSVLVGRDADRENGWLIIVSPISLFGFLRRKRVESAVEKVVSEVVKVLQGDSRFSNVEVERDAV